MSLEQAEKLALACRPATQLPTDEPGLSAGDSIGLVLPFLYIPSDRWVEEPNARPQ
jgi:hypothetical protein